ncbi:DUF817 domain-containing protein [Rhodanobacter hydrolyticus]|uniref:DUF817 domain-containing protein n=1 Tax=Rhodanobacter hydrolyticus TaxID=2250595 RepID=A0ABW8JA29_9GAMM
MGISFNLASAALQLDGRVGAWAESRGCWASVLHEFVCFGAKQASACLFGGCMVLLLGLTWAFYPQHFVLARYDILTLAALAIQCLLLVTRLETVEEAKVILLFHLVGTAMEVFKTAVGSWVYPGHALLHIGGVPLFTGFMYGSIGSYIARASRLFDFRFTRHPPLAWTMWLAAGIYANFFTHHFLPDVRVPLFAAVALLFGRTWVHFRIRHVHRRMPLLLGFGLVALFIWIAENIGTFTAAWRYPAQHQGWVMVPLSKLGAWFLLMIISYVMVSTVAMNRSAQKK